MHKGTFKHGQISTTAGQQKWYAEQLDEDTLDELKFILQQTCCWRGWYLSNHLKTKIRSGELTIDEELINQTIASFAIIEYNQTPRRGHTERRVLLRDYTLVKSIRITKTRTVLANLCFVINIDTGCIVTAYWNDANDNHNNINMSRYERNPIRFN